MMPPNIIFITTDQQRKDTMGCYGSDFVSTPNLDRLAKEGVRFDRAYCANPVCTPSRGSIFTGLQVSNHGAWNIGTTLPENLPTIPSQLSEAGYQCHSVGKCHFQPNLDEQSHESLLNPNFYATWKGPYYGFESLELAIGHPGYDLVAGHYADWVRAQLKEDSSTGKMDKLSPGSFGCEAYDRDLPTSLHSSTWCMDRALTFLDDRDLERSFFLNIGFPDPHHPHAVPVDYKHRVNPERVPMPRFEEGELNDKPFFFLEAHEGRLADSSVRGEYPMAGQENGFDYTSVSAEDARQAKAYYYSMTQMIDDQIGRLLSYLEDNNLLDSTVIVFTSDHGELLGDHGIWMKGPFHYEELVNVPLMIWGPGLVDGGRKTSELVSLVDLFPTMLELAGCKEVETDGISLSGFIRGDTSSVPRDGVLVECFDDLAALRLRTLVTDRFKITAYEEHPFGELYDLNEDPGELFNKWDDASLSSLKDKLLQKMETMHPNDPCFVTRSSYS